jgi:hypothetical protein
MKKCNEEDSRGGKNRNAGKRRDFRALLLYGHVSFDRF